MKKWMLAIGVVMLFVAPTTAYAMSDGGWSRFGKTGQEVTLEKSETHKGSLYAVGKQIVVDGDIEGSLYCVGQNVTINGTVSGDVLCAAQQIEILGSVGDDVRTAGQQVHIDATVDGDVSVMAQIVDIDKDAVIAGDLNGMAQSAVMFGTVEKNVRVGVQWLRLAGEIQGTTDMSVDRIDIEGGRFGGDVFYEAEVEQDIAAATNGKVVFNQDQARGVNSDLRLVMVQSLITTALSMIAMALVVALIAPRFLERSRKLSKDDTLNTVLYGLVAVFAALPAALLLALTAVGLPVAIFMGFAWSALLMLSGPFFAYAVGSWLLVGTRNVLVRMLAGSCVIIVLYIIPLINIFTVLVAAVVGSGMVLRTLTHGYRKPSYAVAQHTKKK